MMAHRVFGVGGRNRFSADFAVRDLKREPQREIRSVSGSEWPPLPEQRNTPAFKGFVRRGRYMA